MRIPLALLADHATAHPTDGKLYVTGGGIKSLPFAVFPAIQPHLALALGIEVDAPELGKDHTLQIESSGPTHEPIFPAVSVTFAVPPGKDPGRAGYFHFVSTMDNVAFLTEGDYAFVVTIDAEQLGRVEVRAERSGGVQRAMEAKALREADTLVQEGFDAFSGGETATAEAIFRTVADRFPKHATGQNNLGFVLLAKGDAVAALEAFARAEELGYPQNEISDANRGCAMYLSGDAASALRIFIDCLETHYFRTPAILFGIGPSGLFPVALTSAADYASLIALNAAWSARSAGDASATRHYLDAARSGELSSRAGTVGQVFGESVRALEATAGLLSSGAADPSTPVSPP